VFDQGIPFFSTTVKIIRPDLAYYLPVASLEESACFSGLVTENMQQTNKNKHFWLKQMYLQIELKKA